MANSDKNIVITPNKSLSGQPQIAFTGAGNSSITLKVLDDSNGTLSFQNGDNEIFSVDANVTTGDIFRVNSRTGSSTIRARSTGEVEIGSPGGICKINGRGLKLPIVSSQSISDAVSGQMIFDSIDRIVKLFDGSSWIDLGMTHVKEGLMIHLDSSNPMSYNGSGTDWYDISGNGWVANMRNLSSSNWVLSPSSNGTNTRVFETNDTNNQGFTVANYPQLNPHSHEIWINSKSFTLGWQTWTDFNSSERILFGTSSNTIHIYPDVNTGGRTLTVHTSSFATEGLQPYNWYQLVYTYDSRGTSIYVNGERARSFNYNSDLNTPYGTGNLQILGDSGSEITSCWCGIFRSYNRALSPLEVVQNFNANRERFGI